MPKGVYVRSKQAFGKYCVGSTHTTSQGDVVVLEELADRFVVVRFLNTDYVTKCKTTNIVSDKVKNHRLPSVYGVGYLDGIKIQPRGTEQRRLYDLWANMLRRAYTEYTACTVAKEWHSFRTFLNSISDVPGFDLFLAGDNVHLDKDIRLGACGVYSVRHCSFVPQFENLSDAANRRWGNK